MAGSKDDKSKTTSGKSSETARPGGAGRRSGPETARPGGAGRRGGKETPRPGGAGRK